jgi:hypothetical protein
MYVQVPGFDASAHDWQVPAQVVAQQTFWAQMPELHSLPPPQADPSPFSEQVPALQTFGATQSASAVQVVLQTLVFGLQL